MRPLARHARALYRTHVLRAAEAVFADEGFEAAKVQDISRRAGLSMGSIYALFPGKEQILGAIVAERGAELVDLVRGVVARHESPGDALEALALAYIDYFHAHTDFLRMQIRAGTAWALTTNYPGERGALAREIHQLQAAIFARGIAERVFIDEDPTYLAVLFTGIDEIHLAQWVAGGMTESHDALRERFLRVVRRVFLRNPEAWTLPRSRARDSRASAGDDK